MMTLAFFDATDAARSFDDLARGVVTAYSTNAVKVRIWWPTPALMATQVAGHIDAPAAHFLAQSLRKQLTASATRIIGFHDWANLTDYESDARIVLTGVAREALPRTVGIHLLVRSPLVLFGIRAASVVLSDVHTYDARQPFEHALSSALGRLGA
jgi:hypothetical protein